MRTSEQIVSDNKLTDAVETSLNLTFDGDSDGFVLGDYVILAAMNRFGEDGIETAYSIMMKNGGMPRHVVVGLIEVCGSLVKSYNCEDEV